MYTVLHRKLVGKQAEKEVFAGSLEPFHGQVVNEMKASDIEGSGDRRVCQGTR